VTGFNFGAEVRAGFYAKHFVIQTRAQLPTHHQPVDQGTNEPGQVGCINFGVNVVKLWALPVIGLWREEPIAGCPAHRPLRRRTAKVFSRTRSCQVLRGGFRLRIFAVSLAYNIRSLRGKPLHPSAIGYWRQDLP
jgi:hypothetical protein